MRCYLDFYMAVIMPSSMRIIKKFLNFASLITLSSTLNILFILAAVAVLTPTPVFAKKKLNDRILAPTGFRGILHPKWPHKAVEIQVTQIEEGSPASSSKLKVGDVIVGLGDKKFERHPLWHLADAVEAGEAVGAKLTVLLKSGKKLDIKLAELGTYSKTAPYNCTKTDKIIAQAADALIKKGIVASPTRTELLALMATGEKAHLDLVAKYIHNSGMLKIDPKEVDDYLNGGPNLFGKCGWTWGYNLIALGEYYLITKDKAVLPAIRIHALGLARGQDAVGCWGHTMANNSRNRALGYGTMNQTTMSCCLALVIAQKCGINDPILDQAVERSYATIANVVGRGGFSYGSGGNNSSTFNNNGTSGAAAIIMSLKGNQKGASYFSQCSATTYDSLTSGHASSFFNPLWTPLGASLSGPEVTKQFFKKSLWYFTTERHWKEGFPRKGNGGFVVGQALLTYCLPRQALLITGREADPSIFVKSEDVMKVIMRSKIDYKKKSDEELLVLLNDDFIQLREKARKELNSRAGYMVKKKKPDTITPLILAMIEKGKGRRKINALDYLKGCSHNAPVHAKLLGNLVHNKEESFLVRVAAADALGGGAYNKDVALPYYNDILSLVLEERTEKDLFGIVDNKLAKALQAISGNSKTSPLDEKCNADKKMLFKVAKQFLGHKRQNVRKIGTQMSVGITKEDFPIIAEQLMVMLNDKADDYHTYSAVLNVDGLNILADLRVKEGLDLLEYGIFNGGGKWAFKYRTLIKALPMYGAHAKPYIPKYEAHKDINKPGDRFTPAWQKAVKKINEDKNPEKLLSLEDILKN